MHTGEGLAARIGFRSRAGLVVLPAPGMLAVLRRRARVTAALTTLSTAAAAIAAAALVPAPAAPATRDSAYVAGRATGPLTPVLPGSIIFSMRWTTTRPVPSVRYVWARGGQVRSDLFMSGRPVIERGSTNRGATGTSVLVSYQYRQWSRRTFKVGKPTAPTSAALSGGLACDSASKAFGIVFNNSDLLASLRSWESCGWLKADGTATVDGVKAVRLIIPFKSSSPGTWYVSQATYLPVRATVTGRGKRLLATYDFRWLPPTRANLAKLALPVPPRGFTRVGS